MATLIATADGNFTAAATWATTNASALLDSEAASTAVSTSTLESSAFTPGAITTDGIAVKLAARAASPSGTFSVILRNTTGSVDVASVTVDVTDLNTSGLGWHFFKFAAPQLLVAVTDYAVRVVCSTTGSQVTLYRNATANNWSRMLRTTSTSTLAASDLWHVMGDYTGAGASTARSVTMNETASTSYGATSGVEGASICSKGTLAYGTATSVNYYLKNKGVLRVFGGGVFTIGSGANIIPASSTAVLEFDSAVNVDSGLVVENNGTFVSGGAAKTNLSTLLTVDAAALATALTVATTTGWAASDVLGFASTSRTYSEYESKNILTVDSGTTLTLSAGLTNAHSGTSPTQAEVINLTQNVKIRGVSSSLNGYINVKAVASFTAVQTEILNMGSGTAAKRGIDTAITSGTFSLSYCSIHEFDIANSRMLNDTGAKTGTWTVDNCVFFKAQDHFLFLSTTSTGWTFTNNTIMGGDTGTGDGGSLILQNGAIGTFNGNKISSCNDSGIGYNNQSAPTSFNSNTIHSCANIGINFDPAGTITNATFSNFTIWRNAGVGIQFDGSLSIYVKLNLATAVLFGNTTTNIQFRDSGQYVDCVFSGITSSGDTTFATTNGIGFVNAGGVWWNFRILNSTFGVVAGIKTAHTTDFNVNTASPQQVLFDNCNLASATPVASQTSLLTPTNWVRFAKWAQTLGQSRSYSVYGTVTTDTAIFGTASPSERLTPNNASNKLESSPKLVALDSGSTAVITARVRKSEAGDGTAYTGNQPRMVIKVNNHMALSTDTAIATYTATTGTFVTMTGTTPVAGDAGVFECRIDCDGTAGWINIDDFGVA
jgi:hypothetical protein